MSDTTKNSFSLIYSNLFKDWKGVTLYLTLITLFLSLLPSILNMFGVDFGLIVIPGSDFAANGVPFYAADYLITGRHVHMIFVTISISIAFLTVILAFVDFGIQKDVSTPIVGAALFCAGCLDVLHLLVAGGWLSFASGQESGMMVFTWFFSRMFHALVITLGVSIFLIRISPKKNATVDGLTGRTYVTYISTIFILLASMTIMFVMVNRPVPEMLFAGSFVPQPYELIPLSLYIIGLIFIFPYFTHKFPSLFSKMLLLSLVPAIMAQLHMGLGSHLLFDNHYNIAHYLKNLSYLIPFIGLALNYLQTHQNEQTTLLKAQKVAKENELTRKLLRGVLDSSTSGILAFRKVSEDEEESIYRLVMANETSLTYLNNQEVQILDLEMGEILKRLGLQNLYKTLSRTWIPVDHQEIEHQHENNWFHVSAVKKYNEIVITFSDITKRILAEKNILENNQKLEVLFHQSFQLIGLLDKEGKILDLNKTFQEFFNLGSGDFSGKSFWELDCWNETDESTLEIEGAVKNASEGILYRKEIKIKAGDNYDHFLDISIKPVKNERNEVILLIPEARDITNQKHASEAIERSESRYRALAGSLPDLAVLLYEKNKKYKLAEGQALSKIFDDASEIIDKDIEDAINPEPVKGWYHYHEQTLKGKSYQIEIRRKNNFFKVYFLPLTNSVGHVYAGLVVFYDITLIKKYQNELEHSIEELNRSNKELEQFAYVASHDLQEPLRKIRTFGERLDEKYKDKLDANAREYISRMQNASQRMQTLIDDLLSFSRISRARPEWEKIELEKILKELVTDFEISIKQKDAKVFIAKMPVIEGTASQLRQLFQNLFGNALKFSKPETQNIIKVSAVEVKAGSEFTVAGKNIRLPNKKHWKIGISDKGIGFEMDYADKIFTIFQRLHGRSQFEGTGIGLSVCKKIVEHHKGIIYAESEPGKGSTFYVVIPEMQDEQTPKVVS